MNTSHIIIIIAIAVVIIAIAIISSHSKHKRVYHEKEIAVAIGKVFAEAGTNELSRKKFLHDFQLKVNCSQKELMFLFGKARTAGLINVDGDKVVKPE